MSRRERPVRLRPTGQVVAQVVAAVGTTDLGWGSGFRGRYSRRALVSFSIPMAKASRRSESPARFFATRRSYSMPSDSLRTRHMALRSMYRRPAGASQIRMPPIPEAAPSRLRTRSRKQSRFQPTAYTSTCRVRRGRRTWRSGTSVISVRSLQTGSPRQPTSATRRRTSGSARKSILRFICQERQQATRTRVARSPA